MFGPKNFDSEMTREREDCFRQMMGDAEATQKQIDRLAKRDLFFPKEVHELQTQLETAIFLIEKLTTKRGIASAAYHKGLSSASKETWNIL